MDAIEVRNLGRIYHTTTGIVRRRSKEVLGLENISFCVAPGELFGLVGPNGAGKTTTVKILITLLTPTTGTGSVLGYDVVQEAKHIRPRIGFVLGGERGLYWRLSGYDNLVYFANLYRILPSVRQKRIPYLLELVGLSGRGDERVQGYSRGMKQRLHIARALLHDPEVVFLDEPTIGLDPIGARETRQVIRNLQAEKKSILLTTHYMLEADELCRRIGVINHGKLIALDSPAGLKLSVQDLSVIEIELPDVPLGAVERVRALEQVQVVSVNNQEQKTILRVHSSNGTTAVIPILNTLQGLGLRIENLVVREPTLEDAYVRLVGGGV